MASRLVWQPVQEYFIRAHPDREPVLVEGTQRLNSFVSYTHLGTDFGFHGPAEHTLQWQKNEICAHLGQEPDHWAGMWHSLSGLARESEKVLNFSAIWPDVIRASSQPRIGSVMLRARGRGQVKLEIQSSQQKTVWETRVMVSSEADEIYVVPVPALELPAAKLINWTAEPGAEICVSSLNLGVERPDLPFDAYVVAASYAKLARCFDRGSGFVNDRAHLEDGAFESVTSTGLFALATATVAQPPLKLVDEAQAVQIVHDIHRAVRALERPKGVLPHFVRRGASGPVIHPGTEYSTVDTAIYYHSLLLAARLLGQDRLVEELLAEVRAMDFKGLRLPDGRLSHGLREDGRTLIPHGWADWGGETALVLMLERWGNEPAVSQPMSNPGNPWQGTGFIAELQSLFYPDFDSDQPDALDGVCWRSVRAELLKRQRTYMTRTWPNSLMTRLGIYGLSAGEGVHGDRYLVGGVDLPGQTVIHPHYILMSATLQDPKEVYDLLGRMEKAGFFTPWGMVEAICVTDDDYLPMQGSLNAAFETLGAYHLLVKHRQIPDVIYEANLATPTLRHAVRLFYPSDRQHESVGE
jgi:hypothetical protein